MGSQHRDRAFDRYRPHYARDDGPPPPPPEMFQFRGAANGHNRNHSGPRGEFNFRAHMKVSERPLLRAQYSSAGVKGEEILGCGDDADAQAEKFRNLDELTDSDEAEMENSDDEENHREPSAKRTKVEHVNIDVQPKWSNPDVYTSLPAPSDTTGKKLDFVKLIRKARNASTKSVDLVANDEDFISFEAFDQADSPPANAPTGPKTQSTDRANGKRKRGEDTGTKLISRRGGHFYQDGMVLQEWTVKAGVDSSPWLRPHAYTNADLALHKEIIDFYEWVKPCDYEFQVRKGVIDRLEAALRRVESGQLQAFGSYAAGLYLPIGDMDLVYLQRGFSQYPSSQEGIPTKQFYKYGNMLRRLGIARADSVTMIPKAKVPIIKYVDQVSGLKVDLSFNNNTGVTAIGTFQRWREQYPAMPIMVAIVKQFLMIRGLNDVAIGGLGGFSIICLVTSLLQHLPLAVNPPNLGELLIEFFNLYGNLLDRNTVAIRMDPPAYVDKATQSRHFMTKNKAGRLMIIDPNRADNNISGGTSEVETIFKCFSRAHGVLLNRKADYVAHDPSASHKFSFLADLIGGDFRPYEAQRDILYALHHGRARPAPAIIPPPPPPVTRQPPPPPPPPPSTSASSPSKKRKLKNSDDRDQEPSGPSSDDEDDDSPPGKAPTKKKPKAVRRAARMKRLRPELEAAIGDKISAKMALVVGKYRSNNEMDEDLSRREKEMSAR